MSDARNQPIWRPMSDKCAGYYDDKQIEAEVKAEMERRGQPVFTNNMIRPAIDGVLGLEAKTRTDWLLQAENEDMNEVVEGMHAKLMEAGRLTKCDRHISDAYSDQIKAGLGWVEVNRNPDPFGYKYKLNTVHRNEIWWDWNADNDLSNARWLMRRRMLDQDEALMFFPRHKELIEHAISGWANFLECYDASSDQMLSAYEDYSNFDVSRDEWLDTERKRVAIFECWYRHFVQKPVIKAGDNVAVLDPSNKIHQGLIASGRAQVEMSIFPVMRLAYFIGPHRIHDVPSPLPHSHFPYVPFFGYREDLSRVPYGLIRGMLSPQDEYNKRRSKLTEDLNRAGIIADSDALHNMSFEQALNEHIRSDSIIVTNPNRKHANGVKLTRGGEIAQQQFSVMNEAGRSIQEVAGIYNSFLGQNSSATSGVAINSLVEQSTVTLSEINDNYRGSKQAVGELMLAFIQHDMKDRENEKVIINKDKAEPTKVIFLNQKDEFGKVNNDVTRLKASVALAEIQSSPGYKAQQSRQLMEIIQTLPDDMKAPLMHLWIESTDHPKRNEISKLIRKITGQGVDPEDMTDEDKQAMEAQQQEAEQIKQMEMQRMQMEMESLQLNNAKLQADIQKVSTDTQIKKSDFDLDVNKFQMELEKTEINNMLTKAEIKRVAAEIVHRRQLLLDHDTKDVPETRIYRDAYN